MATFKLNITPEQNYATSLASEGTAGEDLVSGSLCYLNDDGKYYLASATNIKCKDRELRMAISDIIVNSSGFLLEQGYITLISSFTLGQVYYLSETPGQITNTIYDNGSVTRYIGTAESTSKLRFNPDNFDTDIDFIKNVIRVPPIYVQPTATLSTSTQTVESGTTLTNLVANITFTQNNAGSVTGYSLLKDDVEVSTTQNSLITLSNITTAIQLKGTVSYGDGVILDDNLNEPYPTGQILAGSITSPIKTITPQLKMFYGASVTIPTNSAGVKALSNNVFQTTTSITIATGTTLLNFVVSIPASKNITSVIDTGNLNANITSEYTLRETFNVEDAGGNLNNYKVFAMTIAIPYNLNTNHVITIS
jgi:hypothetical protein